MRGDPAGAYAAAGAAVAGGYAASGAAGAGSYGAPAARYGAPPGPPSGYAASGAASGYKSGAPTNSPPNMGRPARLPPVDERRRASGPGGMPPPSGAPPHQGNPGSPRLHPNSPAPNGPGRQFQNAQRYSLVDPGSAGSSPMSSPRPPQQQGAGTPPLRRPGGPGSSAGPPPPQQQLLQQQNAPDPGPQRQRPGKGPMTFEEMGIATQRAEENGNCVVM